MLVQEGWQLVVAMNDLKRARVVSRWVGRAEVLCVHERGETFVWSNVCPHKLGPLSEGTVRNAEVTCPWHEWSFDLRSGRIKLGSDWRSMTATDEQQKRIRELRLVPVPHRIEDDGVYIQEGWDPCARRGDR